MLEQRLHCLFLTYEAIIYLYL